MLKTIDNVHQQFAEFFKEPELYPYLSYLSQKMSEGHVCIDVATLAASETSTIKAFPIDAAAPLVSIDVAHQKPFVLHQGQLYLQRYFKYETQLLERIYQMMHEALVLQPLRREQLLAHKAYVHDLFGQPQLKGVDWQLIAALNAVQNNFTIITGGPGTGKTTTVAKILAILYQLQPTLKVALAAPTGKAAARMVESLSHTQIKAPDEILLRLKQLKPATIHRLLGWQKGTPYFKHNEQFLLPYDLLVLDESSMIDLALFAKLMAAIGPETRVILLGDKDQLASVEAGSLFGDLCSAVAPLNRFSAAQQAFFNSFIEAADHQMNEPSDEASALLQGHIVALQHSFRFRDDMPIGLLSKAIVNGEQARALQLLQSGHEGSIAIDPSHSDALLYLFLDAYTPMMLQDEGPSLEESILASLQHFNTLRVLCAVRQGEQGLVQLNKKIERYFVQKGLLQIEDAFYEYRPIMVTQNNYPLGLYNGDIGMLRRDKDGVMKAWFMDTSPDAQQQLKSVLPGFIASMETAFAMTIHKSQGSEFDRVLIVLPKDTKQEMLSRELLYTAVTRAKNQLLLQASIETITTAVANQVARGSGVAKRLSNFESNKHLSPKH